MRKSRACKFPLCFLALLRSSIMPGRPKSHTKKVQLARAQHDALMARAVALYRAEQAQVLGPKERRKGGAKICTELEQEYYRKYKKNIKLSPSTLDRLVKGAHPKAS
ncbi:hypothetical protein K438DRAFT_2181064 [Mycena galopus ATCC 62051]|nr:hypothetical protein K438DRAFT_2181064 [Mycena galopus ATCC 62051]